MMESMHDGVKELVNQYRHRQEERWRTQTRLKARSKLFRWLAFLALLLISLCLWKGPRWYWEYINRRIAFRFLHAVLSKDGQTLYGLISPEDRKRLALTPEKAAAVIKRLLAYLGEVKPIRVEGPDGKYLLKEVIERPDGSKYVLIRPRATRIIPNFSDWVVFWGDSEGKPLFSWQAHWWAQYKEPYLTSVIHIVKLENGLWVDFEHFVLDTCLSVWGDREGLRMNERIWQEANFLSQKR